MKRIIILLLALLLCTPGFTQVTSTFFGHLHCQPPNRLTHAIGLALDSTYTGLRPTATAAVGYNSNGGTTVLAFAGIGYFHVTHRAVQNEYYTDYGVSLQLGTGASNGAVSLANATTLGLFGQFFNNLLTVGIGYQFGNKVLLPLAGPGVAFH